MHRRLLEIINEKRQEVKTLKRDGISFEGQDIPPIRDFKKALSKQGEISLIAEIKFASPSAGLIREQSDVPAIGRVYEAAGASAVSLLTDKKFFGGDLENLPRLKKVISIPILRKDFIIDEIQLQEASVYGADAALLIVRILSEDQLRDLTAACRALNMAPLIEVHDRMDLDKALDCGADIIGINNRDLDTFEIKTDTTLELAPLVPDDCVLVSESGIKDRSDVARIKGKGVHAVLVGSSIMASDDPGKKLKELIEAGRAAPGA